MKSLFLLAASALASHATAQAATCPANLAGNYFCVTSDNRLSLATVYMRDVQSVSLLILDFGRGQRSVYPINGGLVFDAETTFTGSCPAENVVRVEARLASKPELVPIREIRVENGVNFRIYDSVQGGAAAAPELSVKCDQVLY